MDKIVRNVIIFAAVILVVAAAFTIFMIARNNPNNSSTNSNVNGNTVAGGNTVGTNTVETPTGEFQDVKLSVSGSNYILNPSTLKKGIPVRMTADLTTLRGCSRDVVISAFGVRKYVKDGDNVITFTPTQTGTIKIACSMNMYRGTFTVVDSATGSATTTTQGVESPNVPVQEPTQTALSGSSGTDNVPTHTCGMGGSGGCTGCGASAGGCGCGG